MYDFNAQEKTERTKVSDSKFLMQPLNDICDNKIIRTSDDNVININEDVDDARGVCVYKEWQVCLAANKTELYQHSSKPWKPLARRLFQAI